MAKRIVMIGSSRETHGGISSMVNVYFANRLFERWDAEYLATHRDGTKAQKARKAASSWLAFMARLATFSVALLHVHIASDASFWRKALFIVPARLLRVPYVLHMHGGDFATFYMRRCGPVARAFLRYLYRHAEVVVALSDEWRDALVDAIPGIRVAVVPNPIEVPAWQAGLEGDPPTVLYLGVVKETKGVFDLLRAWPAVLARHPRARLVLAGSGERDAAQAMARELGIADSLQTPGWTSGEAKSALLRGATVFVLPSHFEALPMAVLEAMAAGLPVVATRVGGIPDAIEDGRDGVLVAPHDPGALAAALDGLLADAPRRARLAAAARRRATETFSAAVIVPRIEAIWDRIAPRAKRTMRAGLTCP